MTIILRRRLNDYWKRFNRWNKYLNNTIKKIHELLDSYGVSSKEQDKEIINHRKFLWDNRNELDEIEINENCGQVALNEQLHAKKYLG